MKKNFGENSVVGQKLVTVLVAAYNKETCISRALDSILAQEVDFEYEILIIDDASTDNTVEVVEEYVRKYPHRIKFKINKKNLRYMKTLLEGFKIIETPFLTILDSDDYWTSNMKMQKAVDFLRNRPEVSIYATNAKIIKSDTGEFKGLCTTWGGCELASIPNLRDEEMCPYFHTSATFFRNYYTKDNIAELEKYCGTKYEDILCGDTFRNYWHNNKGVAHYENRVESVYEIQDDGLYGCLDLLMRSVLNAKIYYWTYSYFGKRNRVFLNEAKNELHSVFNSCDFKKISLKNMCEFVCFFFLIKWNIMIHKTRLKYIKVQDKFRDKKESL